MSLRFSWEQEPGAKTLKSQIKDFSSQHLKGFKNKLREGGGGGVEAEVGEEEKEGEKKGKWREEEAIMMQFWGSNACIYDMELKNYKVENTERLLPSPGS